MLHTIEFTQSVGSVTAVMTSFAIILSSSSLYKGNMCTETVHSGWITGTGGHLAECDTSLLGNSLACRSNLGTLP